MKFHNPTDTTKDIYLHLLRVNQKIQQSKNFTIHTYWTDVHKVVLLKSHVYYFRWVLDICKHERVLQAAKKILGPNIVLLSTCLITKYPTVNEKRENFNGDFVGWHQDLEYCGLVNVEPNEGPKLITMWLAIDKVGTFNNQINSGP